MRPDRDPDKDQRGNRVQSDKAEDQIIEQLFKPHPIVARSKYRCHPVTPPDFPQRDWDWTSKARTRTKRA